MTSPTSNEVLWWNWWQTTAVYWAGNVNSVYIFDQRENRIMYEFFMIVFMILQWNSKKNFFQSINYIFLGALKVIIIAFANQTS